MSGSLAAIGFVIGLGVMLVTRKVFEARQQQRVRALTTNLD